MNRFLQERVETLRHGWGRKQVVNFVGLVALAWIPAMIIHWLVQLVYPGPKSTTLFDRPHYAIIGGVILAPYLETQTMRFLFYLGGKLTKRETIINLVCSFVWGAGHSVSESWGLYAVWPFYVLGVCLLRLRTSSPTRAFWITTALHGSFNALSYAYYLLREWLAG